MHVGLNAVFLQPRFGGIETYVRALVRELAAAGTRMRVTLFVRPGAERADWPAGVSVVSHPLIGRRYTSALSEALLLGRAAERAGCDVLHSLAMTGPLRSSVPHVVTVHDLIWMDMPDSPDPLTVRVWRALVPRVARGADRVICVSQTTADDVARRLQVAPERIDVVHQGLGLPTGAEPLPEPELREMLGLGRGPLVLAVSAKKTHKNLLRLVRAFALVRADVPEAVLVLPGSPSPHERALREEAARLGLGASVAFPPYVSDEELEGLYAAATMFVMPSLYEGFGLPVLEAMARGLPVACSDASALAEVADDAAELFDPHDERAIAVAVVRLLRDPERRSALVAAGRARAQQFSWEATAASTIVSYERAMAQRRST